MAINLDDLVKKVTSGDTSSASTAGVTISSGTSAKVSSGSGILWIIA